MSIKATSRAWEASRFGKSPLNVLLSLADRADDDGVCWPHVATTAVRARLGIRATQKVLRQLEDAGELYFDHRDMSPGEHPFYIVTCGMDYDDIHRVLVFHEKFRYDSARAAEIAAKIIRAQKAFAAKLKESPAEEDADIAIPEGEQDPDSSRVNKRSPLVSDAKGERFDGTGEQNDTEGVKKITGTGEQPFAPYKEEPSLETSVETKEEATRGAQPDSSTDDPASSQPKLRKPRWHSKFPEAAMPLLAALLNATNRYEHWQMGVLPKTSEENAANIALAWHLDKRNPDDFARFLVNWPRYLAVRGKPEGSKVNSPTVSQWIDHAEAVLTLDQLPAPDAVVPAQPVAPSGSAAKRGETPQEFLDRQRREKHRRERDERNARGKTVPQTASPAAPPQGR